MLNSAVMMVELELEGLRNAVLQTKQTKSYNFEPCGTTCTQCMSVVT